MSMAIRIIASAALALALIACGSGETNEVTRGADGMPKGDTGWAANRVGDAFVMKRQIDQLTVSYTLTSEGGGEQGEVTAKVAPCLNGKGEQTATESFTSTDYDDASALAELRDNFEYVISTVNDRCDIPEEAADTILQGFDGLYFRSASDRAEFLGQ